MTESKANLFMKNKCRASRSEVLIKNTVLIIIIIIKPGRVQITALY